jgi:hypothetical protein
MASQKYGERGFVPRLRKLPQELAVVPRVSARHTCQAMDVVKNGVKLTCLASLPISPSR